MGRTATQKKLTVVNEASGSSAVLSGTHVRSIGVADSTLIVAKASKVT